MQGFVQIQPLATPAQFAAHEAAALADGHNILVPTHTFERDGEIVGGVSLGGAVTVLGWFGPRLRARDTAGLINSLANTLRAQGVRHALIPVAENSPLLPHMEKLGFAPLPPLRLFGKTL